MHTPPISPAAGSRVFRDSLLHRVPREFLVLSPDANYNIPVPFTANAKMYASLPIENKIRVPGSGSAIGTKEFRVDRSARFRVIRAIGDDAIISFYDFNL